MNHCILTLLLAMRFLLMRLTVVTFWDTRVLAVGAAAQRQGRRVGVIDVADGALGGRAVHDDAAHAHGHAVFIGDLHVAGVDDGGVAQAAQLQHLVGVIKALLLAVYNKVGQHRGKLFLRQRMVFVRLRRWAR